MLPSDDKAPGIYYWCPIFGNGDLVRPKSSVQPPEAIQLRPDGLAVPVIQDANDVFNRPFHIEPLWPRVARSAAEAVALGHYHA